MMMMMMMMMIDYFLGNVYTVARSNKFGCVRSSVCLSV